MSRFTVARFFAFGLPFDHEAVKVRTCNFIQPDIAEMLEPVAPGGFFPVQGRESLGILHRLVKVEIFFPVFVEPRTTLEDGQIMVAPVFLKVLQRRSCLGDGAGGFESDAFGGFLACDGIHGGESGIEPAVAFPQAAHSALAVVENFVET